MLEPPEALVQMGWRRERMADHDFFCIVLRSTTGGLRATS